MLGSRILSILSAKRIPRVVRVERSNERRKLRGSIRAGGQSSALQRLSPCIDDAARVLPEARGIDDRIDWHDHAGQHTERRTARIMIQMYVLYAQSIALSHLSPSLFNAIGDASNVSHMGCDSSRWKRLGAILRNGLEWSRLPGR